MPWTSKILTTEQLSLTINFLPLVKRVTFLHFGNDISRNFAELFGFNNHLSKVRAPPILIDKSVIQLDVVPLSYHKQALLNLDKHIGYLWRACLYMLAFNQAYQSEHPCFTLSQCTVVVPVYTGMPLEWHWLTQCTPGQYWATQRKLAGYTGTPLKKKIFETVPHWNATEETLTSLTCIGTPLEKLSWNCSTLECHRRNSDYWSRHWNTTGGTVTAPHTQAQIAKQNSIPTSLKW